MRKLEYKHIAPYLQHNLKVKLSDIGIKWLHENQKPLTNIDNDVFSIHDIHLWNSSIEMANIDDIYVGYLEIGGIKPILRPLSQLLEEIECNGETFTPLDFFEIGDEDNFEYIDMQTYRLLESIARHNIIHDVRWLPYGVVEKLIEWNFDINGLIEDGLAIKIENN